MLELCNLRRRRENYTDPKMSKLITILKNNFENEDRKSVLVFQIFRTVDEAID